MVQSELSRAEHEDVLAEVASLIETLNKVSIDTFYCVKNCTQFKDAIT